MYSLETLTQFLISGITVGCVYGLAGIGLSVIYSTSRVINFAQGTFVMLGGMLTYMFNGLLDFPLIPAAGLAILSVGVLSVVLEKAFVRRLRHNEAPLFNMVLATLAFSIVVENAVLRILGDRPHDFSFFSSTRLVRVFGMTIDLHYVLIAICCVVIVAALTALFRLTLIGKAMRASAINAEAASLLGVSTDRMIAYAFTLSGFLGATGGILITPVQYTSYSIGLFYALNGFVAVILGGLGNFLGAFVGGIILGILQTAATVLFGSGMKEVVSLAIMILLLLVRPQGLFRSGAAH